MKIDEWLDTQIDRISAGQYASEGTLGEKLDAVRSLTVANAVAIQVLARACERAGVDITMQR